MRANSAREVFSLLIPPHHPVKKEKNPEHRPTKPRSFQTPVVTRSPHPQTPHPNILSGMIQSASNKPLNKDKEAKA
ncbi:hypothetical protein HBI56_101900 [Parastagonospora nodorum]|nr:hypothetical protein HBH56_030860 [Parastagonospora nodorum]KAH4066580.1 hypothetical protein HBH50_150950 [Parastagonospora nodorum]KAH4089660.1 hypothetical protein HBH48_116050 [Parastagonospora nodorum]KAH4151139.1 hypothetical protein HBH44_173930 [Parastagonospora nodorum]KAH4176065.1 hypothetical protein HBH43_070510 [Parastagonospora nodorum]